ncbi:MAG: hypothetical protein CMI02_07425 [Oceanospirillaceae bacterium]|nr:hypothetical protein [Oceanospirillaceae bacterium]|tara:strand:- start:35 stop:229 length:195 start_codon:yes stop_codon:yes gene_type:complete
MAPDKASTAASYTASAVTTLAGLTINEWVAIGGLLIGVATFLTNLWYRREQLKIQRETGLSPRD